MSLPMLINYRLSSAFLNFLLKFDPIWRMQYIEMRSSPFHPTYSDCNAKTNSVEVSHIVARIGRTKLKPPESRLQQSQTPMEICFDSHIERSRSTMFHGNFWLEMSHQLVQWACKNGNHRYKAWNTKTRDPTCNKNCFKHHQPYKEKQYTTQLSLDCFLLLLPTI